MLEEGEISQIASLQSQICWVSIVKMYSKKAYNLTMLTFLAYCEKLSVVIERRIHARKLCIWCVKTCFSQEAFFLHVLNNVLLWATGGAVEFHWVQLGRFYASKIPNLLSLVKPLKGLIIFFFFFFWNHLQQAVYPSLSHAVGTTTTCHCSGNCHIQLDLLTLFLNTGDWTQGNVFCLPWFSFLIS